MPVLPPPVDAHVDRHLNKCRAYPSGTENRKKLKEAKMREETFGAMSRKIQDYGSAVTVKSSGDISAEPVRGQNIEGHALTDLDLRITMRIGLV